MRVTEYVYLIDHGLTEENEALCTHINTKDEKTRKAIIEARRQKKQKLPLFNGM